MARVHIALYTALFLAPAALHAQQPKEKPAKQVPTAAPATTFLLDTARVCKLMQTALQAASTAMAASAKPEPAAGDSKKPPQADKPKGAAAAAPIKC